MGYVRFEKDKLGRFMIGEQNPSTYETTLQVILSEDDVKKLISDSAELRRMRNMKWKLAGRRHRR